jgi:hypothetical protein
MKMKDIFGTEYDSSGNPIRLEKTIECESCKKMFYVNEKAQRGSARRFCSLRCRNAAYFERGAKDYKISKTENQSLYLKIARLEKELNN